MPSAAILKPETPTSAEVVMKVGEYQKDESQKEVSGEISLEGLNENHKKEEQARQAFSAVHCCDISKRLHM